MHKYYSKVIAAASERHLYMFAVTSQNQPHDGGHVWLLFDSVTNPQRLRTLASELAHAAGVAAETYPTQKTLRLPLGVHRRSQRRGRLLVPGQLIINLDCGIQAVLEALRMIDQLPRNALDVVPPLPPVVPLRESRTHYEVVAEAPSNIIRTYNHSTNMIALLESYGGRIAFRLPRGGAMMHCPCPHHAHGDQQPSLEVQPAIADRYGSFVTFGYAPGCLFYTELGQVFDAFGVYCQWEHLTAAEGMARLSGEE